MKNFLKLSFIASTLIGAIVTAKAVPAAPADTADPTQAQAHSPPVQYRSPFRDYRRLGDEKLIPWKAANDEVGRIGGWRTYAREARETRETEPTSPDNTTTPPAAVPKAAVETATPKKPSTHAGHAPQK